MKFYKFHSNKKLLIIAFVLIIGTVNYYYFIAPTRWHNDNSQLKNNADIPPSLTLITIALGPFRGLIADALWWHISDLQEEGNYFEIMKISTWVAAMQPENPFVWTFHAWNMAYNIADEFPTPDSQWEWTYAAIKFLRNDALSYIPSNQQIKSELAWIIISRIIEGNSKLNIYYTKKWIAKMSKALEFGNREELKLIVEYIKDNPHYKNQKSKEALRIQELTNKQNLDPERMLEIDKKFGPFNWKLPITTALYWIYKGNLTNYKEGDLNYATVLDVAFFTTLLKGTVITNDKSDFFITTNNLKISDNIITYYKELIAEESKQNISEEKSAKYKILKDRFKNLLENMIPIVKLFNKNKKAQKYFNIYKELAHNDKETFDEFYKNNLQRITKEGPIKCKQSIIEGYCCKAFILAIGNQYNEIEPTIKAAESLYNTHQKYYKKTNYELPSFENIKTAAFCKTVLWLTNKKIADKLIKIVSNPKDILYIKNCKDLKINNIEIMSLINENITKQ
jgi:hypothetical protein